MGVKEISKVGESKVMECFEGEKKDFEVYAVGDRKPVKVLEDGGDVVIGAGVRRQVGGGVLDILEFIEGFGREAIEDAVAVIKSGSDECVDKGFSSREGKGGLKSGNVFLNERRQSGLSG